MRVNEAVREILPQLLETYQVIHLCGKDKVDEDLKGTTGYVQYEYIQKELCDILALHKPNILIPLSLEASRGDQILNAASFEKQGFSYVIKEEDLTSDKLLEAVQYVSENKQTYKAAMSASNQQDAVIKVADIIEKTALFTD